ncbi:unnamed protein product [Dibothriocephalus latus]|uniref:Uncharacterized protein n=1 Tax=Dibothriocephalus latus TaxID=60516 RepID=A0A3P7M4V2_DIBLA|nr:unnamed protein product [Dibothriocephalus latus]
MQHFLLLALPVCSISYCLSTVYFHDPSIYYSKFKLYSSYGKPGIVYIGSHQNASEIINIMFLSGTGKLLTLSDRDDIYIWQLESVDGTQPCVKQICHLSAVTQGLEQRRVDADENSTENTFADVASHVTALYANTNGTSIYFGTEHGHVALIHKNTQSKRGTLQHGNEAWTLPTYDESISPQRVLQTYRTFGMATYHMYRLDLCAAWLVMRV